MQPQPHVTYLNLDCCNMPEFNPSKSYQDNTDPRLAVILRVVKSLMKGMKSIADVTSVKRSLEIKVIQVR